MDDRSLVNEVVRFAFVIRLTSLLLVMLMPGESLRSVVGVLSLIFIFATSSAGLYLTSIATAKVESHPILLVIDVLVASFIAASFGSQSPILLYSLSTAVLIGMLLKPHVAGLVLSILVASYLLVSIVQNDQLGRTASLMIPITYVTVGALGSLTRSLHESAMVEQSKARRLSEDAARERERARFAREMHDSVAKSLHGIGLAAAALPVWAENNPGLVVAKARELQDAAESASQDARSILVDLRSDTDDRTLAQQLRVMTDDLANGGINVQLSITGIGDCDHVIKRELVSIAGESIENVRRHSGARKATIDLRGDAQTITLRIEDNGSGFDPDSTPYGHYGLVGMRERAAMIGATFELNSTHGEGTTVVVHTPRTTIKGSAMKGSL